MKYEKTLKFLKFIRLEEFKAEDVYYLCSFFRKKYLPEEKVPKELLSKKGNIKLQPLLLKPYHFEDNNILISKLKEFEFMTNMKAESLNLPKEGIVYYITVNPRSIRKAFNEFVKEGLDHYNDIGRMLRLDKRLYSIIHSTALHKKFKMIDIDLNENLNSFEKEFVKNRVCLGAKQLVRNYGFPKIVINNTRNGYHIIFLVDRISGKGLELVGKIFKDTERTIKEMFNLPDSVIKEIKLENDPMTVIPGFTNAGIEIITSYFEGEEK